MHNDVHDIIALDAMGGDYGPVPLIRGGIAAAVNGRKIILVGDMSVVQDVLRAEDIPSDVRTRITVTHADQVIAMDEDPALAVRAKPNASVRVLMDVLKRAEANAAVSAGSTGATLSAALLGLGRLGKVRRPAIAGALPVNGPSGHAVILVDAGGSPDVLPRALIDWARLGVSYAAARGAARPLVGLLNVGTEHGKGNELTRAAHDLIADWAHVHSDKMRFIGNIEPQGILDGVADVVVTDGFTGNIVVKTLECSMSDQVVVPGGALIIGVRGTVVVAHGAADSSEIASAIETAATVANHAWLDQVERDIT